MQLLVNLQGLNIPCRKIITWWPRLETHLKTMDAQRFVRGFPKIFFSAFKEIFRRHTPKKIHRCKLGSRMENHFNSV